jgi:lipoprotein Spr
MLKNVFIYSVFVISLASCTSLKTAFTGNKENVNPVVASTEKKETKFLEQISTPVEKAESKLEPVRPENTTKPETFITRTKSYNPDPTVENASPLQIKYSLLLNTPVEEVTNTKMFEFIDEWYGTKYRLGGTTKKGIDCSAFSQYLFASVFGISLPRTAREQYKMTSRISRTELKEGDLIFFNTHGGVSHVGVYLQNNKFVHASTSGGVTISDIFDQYWIRRFIGVGRLKDEAITASIASGQ